MKPSLRLSVINYSEEWYSLLDEEKTGLRKELEARKTHRKGEPCTERMIE